MKKTFRYSIYVMIGILILIMTIMYVIYYYNIGIADIVTHTERYVTSIVQLWNIQSEPDTDDNTKQNIYSSRLTRKLVHLYFADEADRYLGVEDRVVSHPDSPCRLAHLLLDALFDGPKSKLNQVLPKGNFLRAVYIDSDNRIAYVDLKQIIVSHFPGGIDQELLAIYAIVNTLTLNIKEIDQVKIIIGGQEANTLAGHLDIRYPYTTNMLIVR